MSVEEAGEVSQEEKGLLLCSVACCGRGFHSTCKARLPQCLAAPVWPEASSAPSGTFIAESCSDSSKEIPLALYTMDLSSVAPALHYSNLLCYPVSQTCTLPRRVHVSTWRRGGGRALLLQMLCLSIWRICT